jgi:hypothetical protein
LGDIAGAVGDNFNFLWLHTKHLNCFAALRWIFEE